MKASELSDRPASIKELDKHLSELGGTSCFMNTQAID
jgi:hypothetical protein